MSSGNWHKERAENAGAGYFAQFKAGASEIVKDHSGNTIFEIDEAGGGLVLSNAPLQVASILATGRILTSASTAGSGYSSGAGGAVSQLTSKGTGVTLSKPCGQITTFNDSLGAGSHQEFTVTNTLVAATDTIIVSLGNVGGATAVSYRVKVSQVLAGSFKLDITNETAGALAEAVVINFAILKAVAA